MTNSSKNVKHYRMKSWVPVFIWMFIIFIFSSQPATESSELSGSITKCLLDLIAMTSLSDVFGEKFIHTLIRKCAHLTVYFILGTMVCRALIKDGLSSRRRVMIAYVICVLYAIIDEFRQLFVPGRSGQLTDVLIDSCGALVGIITYNTVIKWRS